MRDDELTSDMYAPRPKPKNRQAAQSAGELAAAAPAAAAPAEPTLPANNTSGDIPRSPLSEATGTDNPFLQDQIAEHVLTSLRVKPGLSEDQHDRRMIAITALMAGAKPKDTIEGMIVAQMIAAYGAAMECTRLGMLSGQTTVGLEVNLRLAGKLMSTFTQLVEVLDKRRGKAPPSSDRRPGKRAIRRASCRWHCQFEPAAGAPLIGKTRRPFLDSLARSSRRMQGQSR